MIPAPAASPCCGSTAVAKLGEDVTETVEVIPRRWRVVQHVRENSPAGAVTHVFAAERVHGDDTPLPVLTKGKTKQGRV